MKVRILHAGPYADFSKMPKQGAKRLEIGNIVEFPDYYAEDIVASELAERIVSYNPNVTMGAQQLASEHSINLTEVKGTGEKGRITKADVQRVVKETE